MTGRMASVRAVDGAGWVDPEARLAELARSRGALRRVLAGLAAALVARRGWERLGYVRARDYARERLGLSARSLHDLARVGGALARLPRLQAALVSGALSWSQVRLLARFVGPQDEERWIAEARRLGVRALERRVRAVDRGALEAGATRDGDEDAAGTEPMETVRVRVAPALAFQWQRTRTWAARVAGERVSAGTVLEMVTAETLSALPGLGDAGEASEAPIEVPGDGPDPPEAADVCAPQELDTEREAEAPGAALEPTPPLPAFLRPLLAGLEAADAFELDARLRRAVRLEQRLDAEIAPRLRQVTAPEYEWRARYQTLAAFARERLGMSPRKARALLRLERVGALCPELRAAFRDGALSWVQTQILAPLLLGEADGGWRTAWVGFARQVTVRRLEAVVGRARALREAAPERWEMCREDPERIDEREDGSEEAAAADERQTCAQPRGSLDDVGLRIAAPRDVARLFRAVLCSVRRAIEAETGRLPGEDEAFGAMLDHALRSWGVTDPWLRRRARAGSHAAVFERDGWRCTVPGCTSQRSLHAHHVRFRSAGGSDALANLTTLCAAHHQRGVHAGVVRVSGEAPDGLCFELGVRPGRPPLARYRSGDRVA